MHTTLQSFLASITSLHQLEPKNLPKDVLPIGIVALGYPAEEKPDPDRFDVSKIHYEEW